MDPWLLPLVVFGIGIILLSLLAAVIVYNFIRFRFENDKTVIIILVFMVACLVVIVSTIFLLIPRQQTPAQVQDQPSSFSF